MGAMKEFTKGLWAENPIFRIVLGMCPTLAITTEAWNGIGMGLAATFVLVGSNVMISALRNFIPKKIRIPGYIVIIATFVTVVDLAMNAYFHPIYQKLGIFIPLIVVNCIIMARAEAFAAKNGIWVSILDAIGMGIGFTLALLLIGTIREVLGGGTFFGYMVFGPNYQPVLIMLLAPGGFITIALLLGFFNLLDEKMKKKTEPARNSKG